MVLRRHFIIYVEILAPIKDAFRDVFPAATGKDLYDLTQRFHDLADALKPSPQTVENLHRTFEGLFSVLDIGKQIVQGIFTMFGKLFGAVGDSGQGGFLAFTAVIGDFLTNLDQALKKGDVFNSFFGGLGSILAIPIKLLEELGHAIGDLFGGFSSGGFSDQLGGISKAMTPLQKVMEVISTAWTNFITNISGGGNILQSAVDGMAKVFIGLGPAISNALGSINWEGILAVVRTGLFASLVLLFKNFFGKGSFLEQISKGFGGGILENIAGSFKALEGSMTALQQNIKAKTLKEIAIAIALLAASVVALSFVNPDRLNAALGAITVMFGELLGAMAILDKISASAGFIKLPLIGAALILLAGAIDILAVAVFALSKLSWDELLRGLTGVGALLGGISAAVIPLSANSGGMIRAGIGITAIAVALNLMALAVKQMAELSWGDMAKGLSGIAGGLVALTAATNAMPAKGMISMGLGVIALAAGLKIIASAMGDFASMSLAEIGKGLLAIGGSLVIIAGAMQLMPPTMALTAAGLLLVSVSLGKIASAVQSMGGMSLGEIAKGLGTLAGSLTILATALYAMSGSLAGAAALTVAAAGLALLAPAMVTLGSQSWTEIIKGLIALGGALTALGIAGAVLTPTIPSLLGLGAAMLLIGGGLALAGAGVLALSAGISALAVAGPAGVRVLIDALLQLEKAVPEMAKNFVLGILAIADQLANTAPKFVDAILKIINSLLDAIIKASPKIAEAFNALLTAALKILHDNEGKIIQAGFDLIIALLKGIENNIHQVVSTVVDIIDKFLSTISTNLSKIITSGEDVLINLLKGIANHIENVAKGVADIIAAFISAIGKGYTDIIDAGIQVLVKFIEGVTKNLTDLIKTGTDFIITLIQGIEQAGQDIIAAGVNAMIKFMNALVKESLKLVNAGATAVVNFLNGVATAIDAHAPEMRQAGVRVGIAIINGLTGGLTAEAANLYGKISGIMDHAMSLIHKIPIVGSPSKVTTDVGMYIIQGLIKGMEDTETDLYSSATGISNELINKFKDTFKITSPSKVMHDIGQAVGQGFAEGLRGSQDDIRGAFTDMNNKLTDAMTTARDTIKSEQDKLDAAITDTFEKEAKLAKLRAEAKPDAEAIKNALNDLKDSQATIREIQGVLAENEDVLNRTTAGHIALTSTLKDEKKTLLDLAGDYETISKKLEDAQKVLDDLVQSRKDIIASTTATYATSPELDTTSAEDIAKARKDIADAIAKRNELQKASTKDQKAITSAQADVATAQANLAELLKGKTLDSAGNSVDQLATYEDALKHQTTAIGAYNSTLQQLRTMGIDDATYQKLVNEGVADQAFATQLLKGGVNAVKSLNTLDANLQTVSKRLGTNVGDEMYKSGIKVAAKVVEGLKSDQQKNRQEFAQTGHEMMDSLKTALEDDKDGVGDTMEGIGHAMVARMKKALGMKSPSKEMIEIGQFSLIGLAQGLTENTQVITDAADQVGKNVITAMQKSMSDIHGAVFNELDSTPIITPILDLTTIRGQAKELSNLIPITAATSYGQASLISAQQTSAQADQTAATPSGASVVFEQNNYSPEALSEIDIYRQTKNQISQLKSALALT